MSAKDFFVCLVCDQPCRFFDEDRMTCCGPKAIKSPDEFDLKAEEYKREHENDPDPKERARRLDMKKQQALARKFSNRFRK